MLLYCPSLFFFFFGTARRALVYNRGWLLISISLLQLLLLLHPHHVKASPHGLSKRRQPITSSRGKQRRTKGGKQHSLFCLTMAISSASRSPLWLTAPTNKSRSAPPTVLEGSQAAGNGSRKGGNALERHSGPTRVLHAPRLTDKLLQGQRRATPRLP